MVLSARTRSCYLSDEIKPNMNTWPVSGLVSDIYECLIDAVSVGTASLTRQLLKQTDAESKDLCQ